MLFEVFAKDGTGRFQTSSESCIPYDNLDSMNKAGFKFKLDGKRITVKDIKERRKKVSSRSADGDSVYVIRCIETGKTYNKQSDAARDLGIDPAQVSDSIKTGRKRSGYTFTKELLT